MGLTTGHVPLPVVQREAMEAAGEVATHANTTVALRVTEAGTLEADIPWWGVREIIPVAFPFLAGGEFGPLRRLLQSEDEQVWWGNPHLGVLLCSMALPCRNS